MSDLFTGTVGLQIFIKTGVNLTGASPMRIRYTDPNDVKGYFSATYLLKDGVHGVQYTTTTVNDLSVAGNWKFQVYAEMGANKLYGDITAPLKLKEPMPTS